MEHTQNYQLSQWAKQDRIMMEDFNADNAKIDAALAAEKTARTTADAAIQTALAKCGNCTIGVFTYNGNGQYGVNNPTRITFPRMPTAFIIAGFEGLMFGRGGQSRGQGVFHGGTKTGTTEFTLSWSGTTLSLVDNSSANAQLNANGTHQVFAFYAES